MRIFFRILPLFLGLFMFYPAACSLIGDGPTMKNDLIVRRGGFECLKIIVTEKNLPRLAELNILIDGETLGYRLLEGRHVFADREFLAYPTTTLQGAPRNIRISAPFQVLSTIMYRPPPLERLRMLFERLTVWRPRLFMWIFPAVILGWIAVGSYLLAVLTAPNGSKEKKEERPGSKGAER